MLPPASAATWWRVHPAECPPSASPLGPLPLGDRGASCWCSGWGRGPPTLQPELVSSAVDGNKRCSKASGVLGCCPPSPLHPLSFL